MIPPLLPEPRSLETLPGSFHLAAAAPAAGMTPALGGLLERALGVVPGSAENGAIRCHLDPASAPRQGYLLEVASHAAVLAAPDPEGLFHAGVTLAQLATPAPEGGWSFPCVRIHDWPDFERRGLMLDVSRDRVPTMGSLRSLVDLLAALKLNELQLYMEHTFAYPNHPEVWAHASPLTPDEVRTLDGWCRERHIELVPHQQTLGHLHRWLAHDRYRPLAECPDGVAHPWSDTPEPFTLCPLDPGALELVRSWYDDLLPCFSSPTVHAGLDEPLDLGRGRSRGACEARGVGQVYLDYLRAIHGELARRGRRMQFWADVAEKDPALAADLPADVTAMVWGYAEDHPFERMLEPFVTRGLATYVCPGTSGWSSIAGRTDAALANLAGAARAGHAAGARGLLLTDWGDHGHLQPPAVGLLPYAAAAALAWRSDQAPAPHWLPALDRQVFRDPSATLARAAFDLGNTYRVPEPLTKLSSRLFWPLVDVGPLGHRGWTPRLTTHGTEAARAWADDARQRLSAAEARAPEVPRRELAWAAEILVLACDLLVARLAQGVDAPISALPAHDRRPLAARLEPLIARHRALWLSSSRPGGLDDATRRLERALSALSG